MGGLLPSGEKRFLIAAALGLLDIGQLEAQVAAELWRLRRRGGSEGRGMTLQEVRGHLADGGAPISMAWLNEMYDATRQPARRPVGSRQPAA